MTNQVDFLYMTTMAELANWGPEDFEIYASKISNTPLVPRPPPPPTSSPTTTAAETSPPPPPIPYLLSCHDYKGGYHPSEACQGQFPAPATPIYSAVHLNVIDTFIYFSHNLVSIPPAPWINTLHRNGVRALGTFIVEHASGSTALTRLFDKGSEGEYIFATKLAQITEIYGFDGWLMNIEAVFPRESFSPGELQAFLTELRSGVKELVPGGEVIWYDALTVLNQVHWQNGLTLLNVPFFKVSDGLFTNYGWREGQLEATRAMAGTMGRVQDVYSGVDCFGRGSLGDGGFGVGEALSAIHKVGTSAALFAPGWTFEHFDGENFESIDRKFWVGDGSDVESNPVKPVSYFVSEKPCGGSQFFYTSFNRAFGKGWWIDGVKVMNKPWVHIGAQSILPSKYPQNTDKLKWSFTDETAYFGGTSLNISVSTQDITPGETLFCPLYSTALAANKSSIQVSYLLPEHPPNSSQAAGIAGIYYTTTTTTPTKILLPLPLHPPGTWTTATFQPITSPHPTEKITQLGIYYSSPFPTTTTTTILTLGHLLISPTPTLPPSPSFITDVVSTFEPADGTTKLSWKAYRRIDGPEIDRARGLEGCWNWKTRDFASFLVWWMGEGEGKEELVGVSYCLEFDLPAGGVERSGSWRVDGVMWCGGVVRGGGPV